MKRENATKTEQLELVGQRIKPKTEITIAFWKVNSETLCSIDLGCVDIEDIYSTAFHSIIFANKQKSFFDEWIINFMRKMIKIMVR